MRHRFAIRDFGVIAAILAVVAYIAFEIDIFLGEGVASPQQQRLELDETLLLSALLALGLLGLALQRYYRLKHETERRVKAERHARELAYQDPLTGLPNRRQFDEALEVAAKSPPSQDTTHALLSLDLNGFKQINDTHGHGVGDQVLVIVAERLLGSVRRGDLVARLGGDEFVVLAKHLMGPEAVTSIALRMIECLGKPIDTGGAQHRIGAGIGIALIPHDAEDAAEAMRKADVALYRAKAERRSAFRFFEPDMDRLVRERDEMERNLKAALDSELVQTRYRPAIDLTSNAVVGFEAVPCWIGSDGREVPPERFLAIAEETGLIHHLADRVFRSACVAAAAWPGGVTLSIDIYPTQLKNKELGQNILDVLAATGLDPRRLELDVAESTIVKELDAARSLLAPLRQAGISITLDNFGTGYSNLYHMQEFRIDKVKIDRRFTENMGEEDAAKMVRALAGLGQGLGLTVSADGISGPNTASSLLRSGVHQAQVPETLLTAEEAHRQVAVAESGVRRTASA